MKIKDAYKAAQIFLKEQGVDYISDARFLLTGYMKKDFSYIMLHPDEEIDFDEFKVYLEKKKEGMPSQYIVGSTEFMGLLFKVNKNVLIPRQDTEILAETVIKSAAESSDILDICTGSGCIIISLMKYIKNAKGTGIDISEDALKIARENARINHVNPIFYREDILNCKELPGKYDIIVSNPPYIRRNEINKLDVSVKDYEPHIALDGGDDGLLFYRKITPLAMKSINNGGTLLYEIGFDQGNAVKQIVEESGFKDVCIIKDFMGNDRVVLGKAVF